jgi:hypothetical protein
MLSPLLFGVTPLTLQKYSEASQLSFISAIDMGLFTPFVVNEDLIKRSETRI